MHSETLSRLLDATVETIDHRPLGGGCISEATAVTLRPIDPAAEALFGQDRGSAERPRVVVKRNSASMEHNFACEAEGLAALADAEAIRIPKVFATGVVDGNAYLVMEFIEGHGRGSRDEYERFGAELADLHRATAGNEIGWQQDNYLGSAKQPNQPSDRWSDFFADRRIGFQLKWAVDQGLADATLQTDCQTIIDRMELLLGDRDASTSLLHGDLWSGNYLFDQQSRPVLIDPAVYRGCREAEWGMIVWFGGCPAAFTDGYLRRWPLPDGWRRRVNVYLLYHQLNHLNLFGGSYASACRSTAAEILSAAQ